MALPINIKDLAGLSEPIKKLIEVVSQGIGAVYKPYLIKRTAKAKAYELKIIAEAISSYQGTLSKINYDAEKISLASIDKDEISELPIDKRTQERLNFQEQKRQNNIELITQIATENLENEQTVSDEKVDDEWTTRFFNYAQDISNEEMQDLWGRILAGEVKRPKSYSLRTLELLRNLSKEEANIFTKISRFAFNAGNSYFLFKGKGEVLENFDIKFADIALMQELDLLGSSDFANYTFFETKIATKTALTIGKKLIVLDREANSPKKPVSTYLFTSVGKELLGLVSVEPDINYIKMFSKAMIDNKTKIKVGEVISFHNNGEVEHTPLIDISDL